jgi:hypothetical protein
MVIRIEVRCIGDLVSVRLARHQNDVIRHWNDLYPGNIDSVISGWSYAELRRLGDGLHDVTPRR